jgi:hypothetical protein
MHRRSTFDSDPTPLLSDRDMDHLRRTLGDAHGYIQSVRDPDPAASVGPVLGSAEILGAALLDGYLSARYENFFHPWGFPVPLDVIAGVGGLVAAYYGVPGAGHVARGSIGLLSASAFKFGAGLGTRGRLAAGQQPVAITAGYEPSRLPARRATRQFPPGGSGGPPRSTLSEAEMAAISRSY